MDGVVVVPVAVDDVYASRRGVVVGCFIRDVLVDALVEVEARVGVAVVVRGHRARVPRSANAATFVVSSE